MSGSYQAAKTEMKEAAPASDADIPALGYDQRRSFLRMASHELRTPLNSIIGFSEIIAQELHGPVSDPRYRDYARTIRASGMKLLKLVNQVLEIARMEAGAADLHIAPEAPAPAVLAAMRGLEREAAARDVHCRLQVDPSTPLMLVDARGLQTIVTNLLQNAIVFSPEGGEVEIDLRPEADFVLLTVTDHGEGVPSQDLPRLVQPFEQGENALTRRCEGAGLGLSIVTLLCEDMGGALRLASAPGEGLTAMVRLPAALEAKGEVAPTSHADAA